MDQCPGEDEYHRMHAAPCTRTRAHTRTLTMSVGRGSCAPALHLRQESAWLPKSNVSDNPPLHQQGRQTTEVPLYLGSSFNVIYAFLCKELWDFSPR